MERATTTEPAVTESEAFVAHVQKVLMQYQEGAISAVEVVANLVNHVDQLEPATREALGREHDAWFAWMDAEFHAAEYDRLRAQLNERS